MYARILVALDGSALAERVLPHVEALAGAFGSTVILLRATPSLESVVASTAAAGPAGALPMEPALDPTAIVEAEQQEAIAYLEGVAERLRGQSLMVESVHPQGAPAAAIVEAAREERAELIAMTTHGRGGLRRLVFGSVADEVLRTAACPILLVRAGEPG